VRLNAKLVEEVEVEIAGGEVKFGDVKNGGA
jgi:hypothetical protein